MAFDLYSGTFTRYYRREWENCVERMSRESGMEYRRIYAGGEPGTPAPAEEIREGVGHWRRAMNEALGTNLTGPISWDEGDGQPYFSDRPAWDGYSAVLLWAAYAACPEMTRPTHLPSRWADDLAYQKATAKESEAPFPNILVASMWLPGNFDFVFTFPTLVSKDAQPIGSTFALRAELDALMAKTAAELDAAPPIGEETDQPDEEVVTLVQMARFGLGIFREMAEWACKHHLPLLTDF